MTADYIKPLTVPLAFGAAFSTLVSLFLVPLLLCGLGGSTWGKAFEVAWGVLRATETATTPWPNCLSAQSIRAGKANRYPFGRGVLRQGQARVRVDVAKCSVRTAYDKIPSAESSLKAVSGLLTLVRMAHAILLGQ